MHRKISLCLIAGNVEQYIDRCLTSFAPIADEICVVRAIGGLQPDKTIDIARDKFGAVVGEYRNKPGHEDWPHVDDFAAARQMSFDMASGEYLFWCDTDDVLERGAEYVRELADRAEYACYIFPYHIFGRGLMVPRERMVAKGSGKWRYPVHECYQFTVEPIHGVEDLRVVVAHMPHHTKNDSNDRNLRILKSIPESELTAGMLYHMHAEYVGKNDVPNAVEVAKKAVASPDLGTPEKYEIFLNLGRMSDKDLKLRQSYWHQAYAADPTRREALGLLACGAMDLGQRDEALALARQMIATEQPRLEAWNSRSPAYGYVGEDIYQQALRFNGQFEQAEQRRREFFRQAGGVKISLIHATRGRPYQASRARKLWLDFAENPEQIEHIFVFDDDDKESQVLSRMHHMKVPAGGGCVQAWNLGAFVSSGGVFVQMSDDWIPPQKWDRLILDRIGDVKRPRVLAVSDGYRKDQLLCMFICTRDYWLNDYFMFHPWFTGVYSDNWATDAAYKRNAIIEARDIVFEHQHPVALKREWDRTYLEQNAPARYVEGKAIYDQLCRREDWSSIQGWFNYWPFYRGVTEQLKDGDTVCEVGTWLGRSLVFLAQECKRAGKNVKLIAVDTFQGEKNQPAHVKTVQENGGNIRGAFEANLKRCGVADMVQIIEADSVEAAKQIQDGSLAFCFIDAAHDHESVLKDIAAYRPKVRKGGIFAGHDADHEPVISAVRKHFKPTILGPVWLAP